MKNAVFWDVAPCSSCVNRRFGGTYRLHLQTAFFIVTAVKTSNLTTTLVIPLFIHYMAVYAHDLIALQLKKNRPK
jgi:hypothetical protein